MLTLSPEKLTVTLLNHDAWLMAVCCKEAALLSGADEIDIVNSSTSDRKSEGNLAFLKSVRTCKRRFLIFLPNGLSGLWQV